MNKMCVTIAITNTSQYNAVWTRPPIRRYKGKVDASFSGSRSKVGIGVCI